MLATLKKARFLWLYCNTGRYLCKQFFSLPDAFLCDSILIKLSRINLFQQLISVFSHSLSHCGKPQRTVSTKKPLGFPVFTKLARWALPPWIPQQGFHPLHTGADSLTKTTQIIHWIIWVILISPSKGSALASRQREASLWNPAHKKFTQYHTYRIASKKGAKIMHKLYIRLHRYRSDSQCFLPSHSYQQ